MLPPLWLCRVMVWGGVVTGLRCHLVRSAQRLPQVTCQHSKRTHPFSCRAFPGDKHRIRSFQSWNFSVSGDSKLGVLIQSVPQTARKCPTCEMNKKNQSKWDRLKTGERAKVGNFLSRWVARDPQRGWGYLRFTSPSWRPWTLWRGWEEATMGASNKSWNWGESRRLRNKTEEGFLPKWPLSQVQG